MNRSRASRRWLARWCVTAILLGILMVALGSVAPTRVAADVTPPDIYKANAGSTGEDQRGYQTGSPVDPQPVENSSAPNTSVVADNTPATQAHAAFIEPPASAQALTELNNVPAPYPTQANAQCSGCSQPVSQSADGNLNQSYYGGHVVLNGGTASVTADLYVANANASDGSTSLSGPDQFATALAAAGAALEQVNGLCTVTASRTISLPTLPPSSSTGSSGTTASLPALPSPPSVSVPVPLPSLLPTPPPVPAPSCNPAPGAGAIGSGTSTSTSTVNTTDSGTTVTTTAAQHNTSIAGGVVTIQTVSTSVTASSDGTPGGTSISASNQVQGVCYAGNCNYQITAQGVCKTDESGQACANDPANQQLRNAGFNVCRLGTSTSGQGTTSVAGTAMGVLVEWHGDASGHPYSDYYSTQDCSPSPPTPDTTKPGDSLYTVIGESSAELSTSLASNSGAGFGGGGFGGGFGGSGDFGSGGYSYSTPGSSGNGGGGPIDVFGLKVDRRLLYLSLFTLIAGSLLHNLTMLARSRRLLLI